MQLLMRRKKESRLDYSFEALNLTELLTILRTIGKYGKIRMTLTAHFDSHALDGSYVYCERLHRHLERASRKTNSET